MMKDKSSVVLCILVAMMVLASQMSVTTLLPPGQPVVQDADLFYDEQLFGNLPLQFEANAGQSDARVKFLAHGEEYSIFLTAGEMRLTLPAVKPDQSGLSLGLGFSGALPNPRITGLDRLPGVVNYYSGFDGSQWHTGIPTYARVLYQEVYPGIDLVFYGKQRQVEYDFIVAPGGDPATIALSVRGVAGLAINDSGEMVLNTANGELILRRPFIYQLVDGVRREVGGGYVLKGDDRFGFQLAHYDPALALVIDPVLDYSTYFGGSDFDSGHGIALDASGNVYITGATNSTNFPTANAAYGTIGSSTISCPSDQVPNRVCYDVFVTKINAAGNAILYSTYLGGPGDDEGNAIAVDANGNAYITGYVSLNSEGVPDLYIYKNILITKLNATGGVVYFSWIEHTGSIGNGIAVDASGKAYITGEAPGSGFPTSPGAIQPTVGEMIDGFVSVLNPAGDSLIYSTYLGGNGTYCGQCYSAGKGIAVDANGLIYVTGQAAPSFPTTPSAFQTVSNGLWMAFVAKIDPTKSGTAGLVYSTYLGGSGSDFGNSIALDAAGKVYVTGSTQSENFPTTIGAFDRTCGTDNMCNYSQNQVCESIPMPPYEICHFDNKADIFVAKLDMNQSGAASLLYATYVGGSGKESGYAIAVNSDGNPFVAGFTTSPDFPVMGAFQPAYGGNLDGFVFKLNPVGSALEYSSYLGGGGDEESKSIAVDANGDAYLTGYTGSAAFPVVRPLRPRSGGWDAFITKVHSLVEFKVYLPLAVR